MSRQILQAPRFAVADVFDVPWLGVAALPAAVFCPIICATIRTICGWSSHETLRELLLSGALIGFSAAGKTFNRR